MGLTLTAVSADYGYTEDREEIIGEEYLSTDIGYGGFKNFRDALLRMVSGGAATDNNCLFLRKKFIPSGDMFFQCHKPQTDYLVYCFYDNKTKVVLTGSEGLDEDDLKNEKVVNYLKKLEDLKESYPKVFDIYPFIAHTDCEGEMPLDQCEKLLPLVKEFYSANKGHYGYSGMDYNFTEDFIAILEEVVSHKGKLWFS